MPPVSLPVTPGPGPANPAPFANACEIMACDSIAPPAVAITTPAAIKSFRSIGKASHPFQGATLETHTTDGKRSGGYSHHRIGGRHHADRTPVGGAEEHDAAEAGVAADPHHAGIGDHVEIDRTQEMRGLIDRPHRPI